MDDPLLQFADAGRRESKIVPESLLAPQMGFPPGCETQAPGLVEIILEPLVGCPVIDVELDQQSSPMLRGMGERERMDPRVGQPLGDQSMMLSDEL
jgi:hypothetical protein